jgi:hypothetical protein
MIILLTNYLKSCFLKFIIWFIKKTNIYHIIKINRIEVNENKSLKYKISQILSLIVVSYYIKQFKV